MSIAAETQETLRSFRSLIVFALPRFFIKDLKALENGTGTYFYRHVGPTDLKRHLTMEIAGETLSDARMASEGPRATGTSRPGWRTGEKNRDREVSPTGEPRKKSRPGGLSYWEAIEI